MFYPCTVSMKIRKSMRILSVVTDVNLILVASLILFLFLKEDLAPVLYLHVQRYNYVGQYLWYASHLLVAVLVA